ncbi:MAG: hypothetical protein AAGA54_28865 [Myxococcota bacterium]
MTMLRSTLVAALALGVASPTLVACAERPGKKKDDDKKDDKDKKSKKDDKAKKDEAKKDEKKKE